ncbi:MAG: methylenetetrahydrofolate dehydrogenase (NADP+)/methenyltetrahydrofolate cyclohydrolase [Motiliproteus sp.]
MIDGKAFAKKLRAEVAVRAESFAQERGRQPGLAVVQVGSDPASEVYVRTKIRQAAETGIASFQHLLEVAATETELLALIESLNHDNRVDGILVQLPLPETINTRTVIEAIDPTKDVDGFTPYNVGNLSAGQQTLVPCTPLGCLLLLQDRLGDLSGLKAVIVGRSNIVGKPMASLLLNANCTVTTVHSQTRDLAGECRQADILVVAVGRPCMIGADYIKRGAVVLDVGINRVEDASGKTLLVGDVDYEGASGVAGALTPVPGGIGPMTVACLMHNTLEAAEQSNR